MVTSQLRYTFFSHIGDYHPFQNRYTLKINIFELFRRLKLQLSGVCRINLHYSYSFLVLVSECSYRKKSPQKFSEFLAITVVETRGGYRPRIKKSII